MNTEELYIWNYGIDKLPKGLLEFGRSDVCDAKNGADCYSKNGDAVTVLTWQS